MRRTINVGVLGHVDSGKTALCKALSTVASTASFDKHPESQERGITLDLGFSCFYIDDLQVALVDCPGHASLIRTIIGGSQIIDLVFLVIDANKGIETQTAECVVLAKILRRPVVVVFNKMDIYTKPPAFLTRLRKNLRKICQGRFVELSALSLEDEPREALHEHILASFAKRQQQLEEAASSSSADAPPFLFLFDHSFKIRGQGTVFTGTALSGTAQAGSTHLYVSTNLNESYRVKSLQMFHQPVETCTAGDRVGMMLHRYATRVKLERGYLTSDSTFLQTTDRVCLQIRRVQYHPLEVRSRAKFHFSVGHETVLGSPIFFDEENEYVEVLEIPGNEPSEEEEEQEEEEGEGEGQRSRRRRRRRRRRRQKKKKYFAVVQFEQPLMFYPGMKCIASRLDLHIHRNVCRLAFYGALASDYDSDYDNLVVWRSKERTACIDRIVDSMSVIGYRLVNDQQQHQQGGRGGGGTRGRGRGRRGKKRAIDLTFFVGKTVVLRDHPDVKGVIEGAFGKSGKFRVRFSSPIDGLDLSKGDVMVLSYKVNILERERNWVQDERDQDQGEQAQ